MTKKLFLFLTACLLSTAAAIQAGEVLKVHSIGSAEPQKIELASIRKITYVDNQKLITTHGEMPNYTFVLVELDKLTFGELDLTHIDRPMVKNLSVYISTQGEVVIRSEAQVLSLTVYNITGAVVMTSVSDSLNVSALPAGVYLLRVDTAQGTAIQKFIKR